MKGLYHSIEAKFINSLSHYTGTSFIQGPGGHEKLLTKNLLYIRVKKQLSSVLLLLIKSPYFPGYVW